MRIPALAFAAFRPVLTFFLGSFDPVGASLAPALDIRPLGCLPSLPSTSLPLPPRLPLLLPFPLPLPLLLGPRIRSITMSGVFLVLLERPSRPESLSALLTLRCLAVPGVLLVLVECPLKRESSPAHHALPITVRIRTVGMSGVMTRPAHFVRADTSRKSRSTIMLRYTLQGVFMTRGLLTLRQMNPDHVVLGPSR